MVLKWNSSAVLSLAERVFLKGLTHGLILSHAQAEGTLVLRVRLWQRIVCFIFIYVPIKSSLLIDRGDVSPLPLRLRLESRSWRLLKALHKSGRMGKSALNAFEHGGFYRFSNSNFPQNAYTLLSSFWVLQSLKSLCNSCSPEPRFYFWPFLYCTSGIWICSCCKLLLLHRGSRKLLMSSMDLNPNIERFYVSYYSFGCVDVHLILD